MIELAKAEKKAARERWREIKLDQIGVLKAASKPLDPTVGPFNVIYADPPWDYIPADQLGYPTMPLNEICDLLRGKPVVARAAALFLWVPASLIGDGLKVIEAWGFKYRTQAIWAKGGSGMGPYFRVNHEVLLLATRGHTLPEVPPESRDTSVFEFPRRAHSQKPDEFYEVIERMYPEMPKLELFRRGVPRAGWYCWGNEVQAGPAMNHVVVGTTVVEQAPGTMVVNEMLVDAANDAAIEVDVA
jgi:N6-adenosine-specific RNA methylase IME4